MTEQTQQPSPELPPPNHAKERACVSCGKRIPKGHICKCQEAGAVVCPKCKQAIPNPENQTRCVPGTGNGNIELQVICPKRDCGGHLYTYVYFDDLVSHAQ